MGLIKTNILSDRYALKAYDLFQNKNWKIETQEDGLSIFDRFCDRLAALDNDEQRELLLELTEDYLRVPLNEYEKLFLNVWRKFFIGKKIKLGKEERFVICPLQQPKDFGKLKSSTTMLYLCQDNCLRCFSVFSDEQIRICSSPECLKDIPCKIKELILIDDYIGSGETGLGCLEYIKNLGKDIENITILSLVSQKEGIKALQKENIRVLTAIQREKGITDKYSNDQEREHKLKLMGAIEDSLKIPTEWHLGHNTSEALVSMVRTPNNTFPVYWYEEGKGKNGRAPFPRKGNIRILEMEKQNDK